MIFLKGKGNDNGYIFDSFKILRKAADVHPNNTYKLRICLVVCAVLSLLHSPNRGW